MGAPRKILIVDDDANFRAILKSSLNMDGYQVVDASNGMEATALLSGDPELVDLVISDINMPQVNGVELLKWVKSKTSIPVILMTGFSNLLETTEAAKLGAVGFLAKPFKKESLTTLVDGLFKPKSGEIEDKSQDENFCRVSIDDFTAGSAIKFEVYVRISASRYVKIGNCGEDIDSDRVRAYKKKNLHYLYLAKADFRRYVGLNCRLSGIVAKSDTIAYAKKLNLVKHTSEVVTEQLFTGAMDPESVGYAKTMIETMVSVVTDDSETLDLLQRLNESPGDLYTHSVAVSFFSAAIAKKLGWTSPANIAKVSLGGLMHDIGKKELPDEIVYKPRSKLTPQEIALLETHPARGVAILSAMKSIPGDVAHIAAQHHENNTGTGYPANLSRNKIFPLAKVVAVADTFCSLAIKTRTSAGMPPAEAVKQLFSFHATNLDTDALNALATIFGQGHESTGPNGKKQAS